MSLTTGTRLGPYEILSALGAGGMGEVYRARDTRLDRTVAIKVLPSHVSGDPELRERFEREARTVAALNHPHICTLHDVGHQDEIDFLVMEYLEGETLAERIARAGGHKGPPLRLEEALAIAMQIADALDKAHRAGIVHRDLKPGNIMLVGGDRRGGPSGPPVAKLLDFGLAKMTPAVVAASGLSVAPTLQTPVTMQGTILGTLQYMAPEQIEGQEADARTDIFAFGCVLYEMITGRKAFEGKTQASLIGAIMHSDPAPVSRLVPLASPLLDRLVRKCLAKDPDERWQSARDLLEAIGWITDSSGHTTAPVPGAARGQGSARLWMTVAAASSIAVLLAVGAMLYLRPAVAAPLVTRLDVVTPPTADPFSFALSPDGRQLVFVANGERGSQLWLRPLDQVTAQPLAGTDGASAPFWAPDGRALAFFADAKLKRIDVSGGAPQVLADAPNVRGGTWNHDGVIVFAPTTSTLVQVAATGGTATALTKLARGQTSHRWPQFLPDGRRFLFFVQGPPDTQGVYVGSLDGGEPTRVLSTESAAAYASPGYLLLVSQGVLVARRFDAVRGVVSGDPLPVAPAVGVDAAVNRSAFAVSTAGVLAHRGGAASRRQLVWVDRAGKTLGVVGPPDDTQTSSLDLAPDGRQVATNRVVQGNSDVWLINVARGLASRFTFAPAIDASPVWSPDGSRVVFRSNRNGHYDLFEKPANGAADEQPLLVTPHDKSPLSWSPDGRFLLYAVQDPTTQCDLWAVPLAGERTPFPVVQTSFDEVQGQFSPDGRWVAYASNETGRYEIYIRPFPDPGGKRQVSIGGGIYPRWRRDGKELLYVALDNRVMVAPIQAATDGRTLSPSEPVALFPSRLTAGNTGIGGYASRAQYAVAPDGRFLMNVSADDATAAPITIVQNWTAGLKR